VVFILILVCPRRSRWASSFFTYIPYENTIKLPYFNCNVTKLLTRSKRKSVYLPGTSTQSCHLYDTRYSCEILRTQTCTFRVIKNDEFNEGSVWSCNCANFADEYIWKFENCRTSLWYLIWAGYRLKCLQKCIQDAKNKFSSKSIY
jgi:hypothetical protein